MAMKQELEFGLDNFGKQKKLSLENTIAKMVLNLFLLKPGQLPSLPHVGMDIQQYLYRTIEDIDVDELKRNIVSQCETLSTYVDISSVRVLLFPYQDNALLYIIIPLLIENDTLMIGFKKDNKTSRVTFNYKITDEEMI